MVRRDWCPLSKDVSSFVLNAIMSGNPNDTIISDIHSHLRQIGDKVRNNEYPVAKV